MQNIWRIARYEYGRHVRRRGFLFTAFGLPFLFAATIAVIVLIISWIVGSDTEGRLGLVDQSGQFAVVDVATLDLRETIPVDVFPDEAAARAAFDANAIDAFVVIPVDYLQNGQVRAVGRDDLSNTAEEQIEAVLQQGLIQTVPEQNRARLGDPLNLDLRTLDTGRTVDDGNILLFLVPYLFATVFFVTTFTTSGYLIQAITEEKEDRVMEILATTVRPTEMMVGKVWGLYLLGLTQLAAWAALIAVPLLVLLRNVPQWSTFQLPWTVVVAAVLYFLLGYLLIAGCYAAAGAAVPSAQEAGMLIGPISFVSVLPLMLIGVILGNPNGPLATVISLIPFSAPTAMLMRLVLADVPAWQVATSLVLLALTAAGAIWLAARVMRLGMLRYGKRLSLREVFGR
jgi:ABC-2 type transport system permease protein